MADGVDVDWFLAMSVVIGALVLLAVNVYVLVYFQHPDDKRQEWFPKFVVVFGLTFAEGAVLLLPLDVANRSGAVGCVEGWNDECGGLDMEVAWDFVFMTIAIFLVLLGPFCIFYYEADDGMGNKTERKWVQATKYTVATLLIAVGVLVITFVYGAVTEIPVTNYVQYESNFVETPGTLSGLPLSDAEVATARSTGSSSDETVNMDVTFQVYVVALMGFVGWFLFVVFAGVGIVATPLDLILAYIYRPKFMPADVYAEQRLVIQKRVNDLIEIGNMIAEERREFERTKHSSKEARNQKKVDRMTMNKFKQMVFVLEREHEDLKVCHNEFNKHNPLVPIGKLILGAMTFIVSLCWIIQVCVFMLPSPPADPFLNDYFIWFDSWFPLFGTATVGIFSLYLLAATVKGCFKFGLRFMCISLHPMKLAGTMMNSFVFNVMLIMLCTLPVVQFCTQAFADYARLTDIETLFGVQVKYLRVFSAFWVNNLFVIAFLAIAFLTMVYLLVKPRDAAASTAQLRDTLRKRDRS